MRRRAWRFFIVAGLGALPAHAEPPRIAPSGTMTDAPRTAAVARFVNPYTRERQTLEACTRRCRAQ